MCLWLTQAVLCMLEVGILWHMLDAACWCGRYPVLYCTAVVERAVQLLYYAGCAPWFIYAVVLELDCADRRPRKFSPLRKFSLKTALQLRKCAHLERGLNSAEMFTEANPTTPLVHGHGTAGVLRDKARARAAACSCRTAGASSEGPLPTTGQNSKV